MKIIAAIHSSFPRIGEHPDEQKLRRASASLDDGKISIDDFVKTQDQVIDEIIAVQEKAGIEILTDGLIRRYDPASHLAKNFRGFEINGLLRFFDTNFYYRQPVITGAISIRNEALSGEVDYISKKTNHMVKAVMLGPLSLAAMSLNKSSRGFEDICCQLGKALGQQAAKMVSAGANLVQLEEPWLARNPEMFDLFLSSLREFNLTKGNAQILVSLYFGDAGLLYDRLSEIPADMLGIDFTYSPGLLNRILADGFAGPLALGVLDGRNTKIEDSNDIAKTIELILKKINASECHITTSCGLEFLPRQYAIKKLELTTQVVKLING